MNYMFDYIMIPLQLIVLFFTIYYLGIAIFGLYRKKETKITVPQNTFAIIIAAHNEEQVIGQLVENIFMMNYPRDLYDIYVVADNCTDRTAHLARAANAITLERFDATQRGKGYALEWMFGKLFEMEKNYDAVAIFDADNLVDPNFLSEMNNRLCKGEKVIQGYLDAKNPHDSWVSGTFSISFWVANHIWHLAKYNLGLSSILGGTGMCISTDILKKIGWGATCLTEDMEFTMKVLLCGIRTTWAHDAIVYDEKPLTFSQSWKQRKRWVQGHFDVARRFVPKLFVEGIRQRKFFIFDGIFHLLKPHLLLMSSTLILLNSISTFIPFYTNIIFMLLPIEILRIIAVGQYLLPVIILLKIHAQWRSWEHLFLYPLFIYTWIPITIIGFFKQNQREWFHTPHTRGLSYRDMLLANSSEFTKDEHLLSKQAIK